MKQITIFNIFLLMLAIFISCKSPTSPKINNPPDTTKINNPPDTTSHNFAWTQYTFGGLGGSSYFRDVAIVSDSEIWAVGGIFINDSAGMLDPIHYNVVHWNGLSWSIQRLKFFPPNSIGDSVVGGGTSIFARSRNDIWLAAGVIYHYDGSMFNPIYNTGADGANRIWGDSAGHIWFVCNGGKIFYYSNGVWTKQESGTTIDLRDIWGSSDGKTVWACGYSYDNSQSVLLKYDGTSWQTIWSSHPFAPPYGGLITSLWGDKLLYLVGTDGVFKHEFDGKDSVSHLFSLTNFPYCIKGSSENNIAFVGDNAMIYHFNGSTWKLLNLTTQGHPLYSVALSKNIIIAVGSDYSTFPNKALIYFGVRN